MSKNDVLKHIMVTEVEHEAIVTDKKGRVINVLRFRARSWLYNFIAWLYGVLTNNSADLRVSGGSYVTFTPDELKNIYLMGGAGEVYGIMWGADSSSPTPTDYDLVSPYTESELAKHAMTAAEPAVEEGTSYFTLERKTDNVAGRDIVIYEVGLYARLYSYTTEYAVLLLRDVISGGFTVPADATLTWRIKPKVTT
ncbi:MAG: hypothetical protein DRO39_02000 [Thermoprotei archaeon]|nr:MAG: hypothetical protein DRO39_02000 [Thermoprotei archaeon]